MESDQLKLNIKMMNSTLNIEISKTATVLETKTKIKEQVHADEADQKLIYKGENVRLQYYRKDTEG